MKTHFSNYAKKIGKNWYQWRIFVDEDDATLDKIEYVLYLLHQTFPNPARIVYDRKSRFALEASGRGSFTVFITVEFKDGKKEKTQYDLDLKKKWPKLRIIRPISESSIGELGPVLREIQRCSMEVLRLNKDKFLTNHTVEGHSDRIVELLNAICEDMMNTDKRLNKQEMFVLLAAVYLHDIGMRYDKEPTLASKEVRERHHIFSEEMILGSVRDRSKYRELGVPEEYVVEIAKVCKGHRKVNLYDKEFDEVQKRGERIRVRLLAALLSQASDLDLTYERIIAENLSRESIPQESRVHWWRHHYIEDIRIERNRIRIRFVFPSKVYEGLIVRSIEDQIDRKLGELRDILWRNNIRLFLGDHIIEYSKTKLRMAPDDLDFLREIQDRQKKLQITRAEREISNVVERARSKAGLNTRYRRYVIGLDYYKPNPEILQGLIRHSAIVRNETWSVKELFHEGKICDGFTTVPGPLRTNPPEDPEFIFSFEELEIDGESEKIEKRIRYLDPKDRQKGIRRDVFCSKLIAPGTTIDIDFTERVLLDKIDNLSRRFWNLSFGIVEVHVQHPPTILPDLIWYSRSETDLKIARLVASPTLVIFMAEGRWEPGSGFLLSWRTEE